MSIWEHLKRFNQRAGRAGSVASLFVLLGPIAFLHWSARFRMDMANRQFVLMDDRAIREMMIIDFIHGHLWILAAYAAVFFGSLLWLEFRSAPRWSVWLSFIVFTLPFFAYARACLHISRKLMF